MSIVFEGASSKINGRNELKPAPQTSSKFRLILP